MIAKCVLVGRLPCLEQHDYIDRTGTEQYINPMAPYSLTQNCHISDVSLPLTETMWICSYCGTFKEASIKLMVCQCQVEIVQQFFKVLTSLW